MDGPGKVNPTPPATDAPLTPQQKKAWNDFLDYLKKAGYQGNKSLDNHNMALGQNMLNRFNAMYPGEKVTYAEIPKVQAEMQNIRQQAVANYKKNPSQYQGVKSEDDIMQNLSPVDGWLGSKTSMHKFPTATLIVQRPAAKADTTFYGTNTATLDLNK